MSTIVKSARRIWKSAQLYIGFHRDQKGNARAQPKVWPPNNAKASIHPDAKLQETFLVLETVDRKEPNDIQIKMRPDRIVLRRDPQYGWQGIIVEDKAIAVKVNDTWIKVGPDGSITHEDASSITSIDGDGSVFKKTEFVEALMSYDGMEISRRTPDTIAAVTPNGMVVKARDND